MKTIFAIGVGGTGAKCIEALVHLHGCGLLTDQDGNPARLGVFLVEPDQQSALLVRAQTAQTGNVRNFKEPEKVQSKTQQDRQ